MDASQAEDSKIAPPADGDAPAAGDSSAAAALLAGVQKAQEDDDKIQSKALQMVFNPERDRFPNKCYYDDGDPDMYTKEA